MSRFQTGRVSCVALVLFFLLSLTGCKKEDPNPELMDPIYADLDKRANEAQKSLEEEKKKIEEAQKKFERAEPNSIELKDAQRDVAKARRAIASMEQRALYYKIRAQRRLLVDRISYKAAFAKEQPWPDKHEYSDYLVNMRLQESSRNWGSRVPKLQDRLSRKPASDKKEEKKASGHGE